MSNLSVRYKPILETTPEAEADVLCAVYRLIVDCHTKKNPAAGPSERGKHDGTAKEDSADVLIVLD